MAIWTTSADLGRDGGPRVTCINAGGRLFGGFSGAEAKFGAALWTTSDDFRGDSALRLTRLLTGGFGIFPFSATDSEFAKFGTVLTLLRVLPITCITAGGQLVGGFAGAEAKFGAVLWTTSDDFRRDGVLPVNCTAAGGQLVGGFFGAEAEFGMELCSIGLSL